MARINNVEFIDNSREINREINAQINKWLYESAGVIQGQAARNTRVDTGQLKNSWEYKVDESNHEAFIGSPLENAIWEEFGTGEYAVKGDGRKGGWFYPDPKGRKTKSGKTKLIFTKGKTPNRTLERAFTTKKKSIEKRLVTLLGEVGQ